MGKKLVKKTAPPVVETEEETEYPDTSPNGAAFVFADDNGVAHYQDGSSWVPDDVSELVDGDDEEVEPEEEVETEDDEVEEPSDEDADEEDEEEPEEDGEPAGEVGKRADSSLVGLDALALSSALVNQVQEIFSTETDVAKRDSAYENVMLAFNRAMDTAAGSWATGESISKRDDAEAVSVAVDAISETYTNVVESVGGTAVSKKDDKVDIYKGLTPEAAEIVRKSAEVIEANEVAKWEGIAKNYVNVPGDKSALAKALRVLHDTDPEQYEVVKQHLEAANNGLHDSEVFKSFGRPGVETDTSEAQALVSKGEAKTIEEAELILMERNPGKYYTPTNA